jgi:CO/xanthine dehydrogenase FAD-binding subunit
MRSFLPDYEVVTAQSVPAAVDMLASNEAWRPISGGTDLMVLFNAGRLPYRKLVSVREIPELRGISVAETEVVIGAAATYTDIREHVILQREFPLLCAAASWTGGIANQNRGTIGGNIINASPAADSCPPLLVYDAELELASSIGARRLPYVDFHTGYKQMDLRPGELLVRIHLPRHTRDWRQYSRKVGPRRAQAISKICFAATARMNEDTITDVRIAAGSIAPIPLRCIRTEAALRGNAISANTLAEARTVLMEEVQPITDIRSTAQYRRVVTANLLEEFLSTLH